MRIFAYDRFKPGVTLETIEPYLPEEVANVWRLWKGGIVRENYARADEPGVVIVFEVDSVEDAKRYTDDFPLTKAGFLEWFFIPLMIPLPIESLFRPEADTSEPYDRTTTVANELASGTRRRAPCSTTATLPSLTRWRMSAIRIAWPWWSLTCRSASSGSLPTARR
jgi:hypothetical protein